MARRDVTVSLDESMVEALEFAARRIGTTVNGIIGAALSDYMSKHGLLSEENEDSSDGDVADLPEIELRRFHIGKK